VACLVYRHQVALARQHAAEAAAEAKAEE